MSTRSALSLILTVSVVAVLGLIWLIYFNPGQGQSAEGSVLPALNASLNSLSAACLILGYALIRQNRRDAHRLAMIAAFIFSSLFLISYVYYHFQVGDTKFTGQGIIRPIYFTILISHIFLSVVALPMILTTFFFSLSQRFEQHRKLARWTFPIWLYVSVTGVAVFLMLKLAGS